VSELRVGALGSPRMLSGDLARRSALVRRAAEVGVDHLFVADHVSFHTGLGMDGLVNAATLLAMDARLEVHVGVYLLPLRHPVLVARQLATIAESAPGRLVFGVGVGGEDPHEIEICGVDPRTRGRRADEALAALRELLRGEPVTQRGEFFSFEGALIRPAPDPAIPILVGGRSDAALRRAARFGEGWLAAWCSARRFGEAAASIEATAREAGRADVAWRHGLQVWTGCDRDAGRARERLAAAMQAMYRLPFEPFERYSPCGTPERIAEFLAPYAEAGCSIFNVMAVAPSEEEGLDAVAEVRERLHTTSRRGKSQEKAAS
jgi:alkanesulfonate monooxygenase SsuD/methylene tetrahydromethanopterin reductase-like flavin-dependent oxidoreductase (luciferase family)